MDNLRQDLAEKDMDLRTALDNISGTEGGGVIVGEHLTEEKGREGHNPDWG